MANNFWVKNNEFQINTNTITGDHIVSATSVLNDSKFVIVWPTDISNGEIYGQLYDTSGNQIGSEFKSNPITIPWAPTPSICNVSNGFVVLWQDNGTNYAQLYDNSGVKSGDKIQINTVTGSSNASCLGTTDEGFVAVFGIGGDPNGNINGVYGQKFDSNGNIIDSTFKINSINTGWSYTSSIKNLNNDVYIVIWQTYTYSLYPDLVRAQLYNNDGSKLGNEIAITPVDHLNPTYGSGEQYVYNSVAALQYGDFMVSWKVWESGINNIYGQRFNSDGNVIGAALKFNPTTFDSSCGSALMTLNTGKLLAVLCGADTSTNIPEIYGQWYDVNNNIPVLGTKFNISTTSFGKSQPYIAKFNDNKFAIIWESQENPVTKILAQVFVSTSSPISQALAFTVDKNVKTALDFTTKVSHAEDAANAVKVKIKSLPGCGKLYDASNQEVNLSHLYAVSALQYNSIGCTTNSTSFAYVVVDTQNAESGQSTVTLNIRPASEFKVNTYTVNNQEYPSIASLANGGFVIAWQSNGQDGDGYGVYAQKYDANGIALGFEFKVNTYTVGDQKNPSIASFVNGGFVIAWQSNSQDGGGFGVYAQMYDASGDAVNGEFKVSTNNISSVYPPIVTTLSNGGFIVTFSSYNDNSGWGTQAQIFDANNNKVGAEFEIGGFYYSKAASLSNGEFVIMSISGADKIYVQKYNANGDTIGLNFTVETYAAGGPNIASFSDGGFVIIYGSMPSFEPNSPSRNDGVFAQRYDANGNVIGAEFKVNSHISSSREFYTASVASLSDGGFVITWDDATDNIDYYRDIYAQRYDSNGNKVGSEVKVNNYAADSQQFSNIASLRNGGFIITWSSNGQDGDGYGVYAKRYDASGNPVDPGVPIPLPNTVPSSQAFNIVVNQNAEKSLDFAAKVSDREDADNLLKIKVKTLPSAGKLYDKNNAEVVVGNTYAVNELVYKETATTATSDSFAYTVVDSKNAESDQSTVTFTISSSETTSSTAISSDASVISSTSSDAATSQSTVITIPNTPPQSNYFQLKVNKNGTADVKFKSVISDKEDSIDKLQIKINHSPECGKLYNVNKEEITLNQPYSALESMLYEPINCTDSKDSFSYVVVDTEGTESNPSSVDISIIDAPYIDVDKPPTVGVVSFSTSKETKVPIKLSESEKIIDNDNFSELKVKIKSEPLCGKIYDTNNNAVVLNQLYDVDALIYDPLNCDAKSYTFNYSVVDTAGNESEYSTISITINGSGLPSWATAVISVVGGASAAVGAGYKLYKWLYPPNPEPNPDNPEPNLNNRNNGEDGRIGNNSENQNPELQNNDNRDNTNRISMDRELGNLNNAQSSNVINSPNILSNNLQQPDDVLISQARDALVNNVVDAEYLSVNPNEIALELQNKIEIGNDDMMHA